MKISSSEFADIRQRVADGTASDDDRRLFDLYSDPDEGTIVRDGEGVVSAITGHAEAEVVKGDEKPAQSTPKKRTRGPAR